MNRERWQPLVIFCLCMLTLAGCSKDRTATGYLWRLQTEEDANRCLELYEEFTARYPEQLDNPACEESLIIIKDRLAQWLASRKIARYTPFIEEYLIEHPASELITALVERVRQEKGLENLESTLAARGVRPLSEPIRKEIVRLVLESRESEVEHQSLTTALNRLVVDFPGLEHLLSLSRALQQRIAEKPRSEYPELLMVAGDFARFGGASPELAIRLYSEAAELNPSLLEDASLGAAIACARAGSSILLDGEVLTLDDFLSQVQEPSKRAAAFFYAASAADSAESSSAYARLREAFPNTRWSQAAQLAKTKPRHESETDFQEHIEALTSFDSRIAGYPGSASAAAYLRNQLEKAGAEIVLTREFPMTVPVDQGGEITLEDGTSFPLHCLFPNDVRTSTLPREGVQAPLLWVEGDFVRSLNGRDASGAFLLCDFNTESQWLQACTLAPKGFIFIEPETTTRQDAEKKFVSLPLDVPRLWVNRPTGAILKSLLSESDGSLNIRVTARMQWQTVTCRNIIARIEGTDPSLSNQRIVLCAHYDSISVVPSFAPGAESSCSAAALIELTKTLTADKPRRTVLIAALDAHYLTMAGAARLMRDLNDALSGATAQGETNARIALAELRGRLTAVSDVADRLGRSEEIEWTIKQLESAIAGKDSELATLSKMLQMATGGQGEESVEILQQRLARLKALEKEFGSLPELKDLRWKTRTKLTQARRAESRLPWKERNRLRRLRTEQKTLVVNLDITSGSKKVGLFQRSSYEDWRDIYIQREYSGLARSLTQRVSEFASELGWDPAEVFADTINATRGQSGDSFFQEAFALSCDVIGAGVPAITFATCNDPRTLVDTPFDTPDKLNHANLQQQLEFLKKIINPLLSDPNLDIGLQYDKRVRLPISGRAVTFDPQQSLMPDTAFPNALAVVRPICFDRRMGPGIPGFPKPLMGVHTAFYSLAGADGRFSLEQFTWPHLMNLRVYGLGDDGSIIYANDFGENGNRRYNFAEIWAAARQGSTVTCVLFPCASLSFAGMVDPRYMLELHEVQMFDAVTQCEPLFYGFAQPMSFCYGDSYTEPCLVTFAKPGSRIQLSMSLGAFGRKLLLLNSTEQSPEGIGIEAESSGIYPFASYRVAKDLWLLNESRRKVLAEHAISNETIEHFHQMAGESLQEAESAQASRNWSEFLSACERSWAYSSRIYANLLQTSNDTVKCVIFYLALVVPFAYFMERLLFAFADLRKSIAASAVIFIVVLMILMQVHPAFAISMTPFLIFLAFTILVLGVLVGGIVMRKLGQELERIRGGLIGLQRPDVNRFSATLAAFNLGVSHMRRRKVRTSLTCGVLVLLTFTVLSFTSIRNYVRFNRYALPWSASYEGLLFRNLDWTPMEVTQLEALRNDLDEQFIVAPRAWHVSRWPDDFLQMEARSTKGIATFQGIAGLSSNEPSVTRADEALLWGRWFKPDERDVCLLPQTAVESLGITQQGVEQGSAMIQLVGMRLRVVGVFREDLEASSPGMNDIVDLNGEDDTLMPTTYVFTSQVRVSDFSQGGIEAAAQIEFAYLDARSVAIVPFETVLAAGGTVRSVAAVPKPNIEVDLDSFLTDLMLARSVVAYAGLWLSDGGGQERGQESAGRIKAMLYSSVGAASMKGLRNLAIPIAIAALTILNTLLGSVYEREKEIWTYSSVGLSPIHIACLFIAEACVFGVIGSVGGYLIAQVIGKLVTSSVLAIGSLAMSNPFFLPGLTLNFSSTSAVASVMLVMLVTLLSAIYPAKRAHELATPEIERRWQLAPPTSEQWRVRMPFIVRHAHVPAMNAYLYDFLDMHRQEMVGNFFVAQLGPVQPDSDETLVVEFDCWLAPYDFGVSQRVRLATVPTGDEDLETFHLILNRKSGDVQSWLRTNRAFLNELRKALLIWRTMSTEGRAHYEQTAQKIFEGYCDTQTLSQENENGSSQKSQGANP